MSKTIYILFLIMIISHISFGQNSKTYLTSNIFENPPDSIPKIFAKGIISLPDRYEYGLAISPNYDEVFFTAEKEGLMVMKKQNNCKWTKPEVANLRGNKSWEFEAFYSPNGEKLYFASDIKDTSYIWYASKENNNWSVPKLLESPVNNTPVFWATVSSDNTMYYTNLSVFRIYKSEMIKNKYEKTEDAGLPFGVHPYIADDNSFMLFNGKGDLYIVFRTKNNKWSNPTKLDTLINTKEFNETCPSLSPDKKYIFFSRYNDINEKCDIYWVNSSIIDKLRKIIIN